MPIDPTLREHIEHGCVGKASQQGQRATVRNRGKGWVAGDGWWSERWIGSTDVADFASVTSAEPTFTKLSFR